MCNLIFKFIPAHMTLVNLFVGLPLIDILLIEYEEAVCFYNDHFEILKAGRSNERRQTKNTLQRGKSIAAIYTSGKIIDRVGKTAAPSLIYL